MKTCVIHYRPLSDRLENFDKQVNGRIEYQIIDNEVGDDSVFDTTPDTILNKIQHLQPYSTFGGSIPPITKDSERSVAVKQLRVWLECAEQDEPYLVLEDDVIFNASTFDIVDNLVNNITDWDIIMMGISGGLKAGDNGLYKVEPPMTKGLSAYLLNPEFARKMKPDLKNISMAVDWELNYLTQKHNCRMLWLEPAIFGQGSQGGPFKSAIQDEWR
jgi:hypothetical protein